MNQAQAMSMTLQQIAAASMTAHDMIDLAKATVGEYCAPAPDGWRNCASAPKDGTHILVCNGKYDAAWTFDQAPPMVVHYFPDDEKPGFYLSAGIVQGSYNDHPINFERWMPLPFPPTA